MAAEGKKSPFTFKKIVLSVFGLCFSSWGLPKLLDYFLDTTLLTTMQGWLSGVWSWLTLENPQPNWLLVGFMVSTLILGYVIFYFVRLYNSTLNSLDEERASKAIPTAPELSRTQIYTLMRLGTLLEGGQMIGSMTPLGISPLFNSLENEIALEQLELMGLVQFSTSVGTTASTRKPVLTLKGKEYVVARREASAKKAEQRAKDATTVS